MSFIQQKDVNSDMARTITLYVNPYLSNNGDNHNVPLFGRFRIILKRIIYHSGDGGFTPEYSNIGRVPIALVSSVLRPKHFMTKTVPASVFDPCNIYIISSFASGKNLEMDLGVIDIYNRIDLGCYIASTGVVQTNMTGCGVVLGIYGESYKPYIPKSIGIFRQFYIDVGAGRQSFDPKLIGRFRGKLVGWMPRPRSDLGQYRLRLIQLSSDNIRVDSRGSSSKLMLTNMNEFNGYMMAPMNLALELETGRLFYEYYDVQNQNTSGDSFVLWLNCYSENDRLDFVNI